MPWLIFQMPTRLALVVVVMVFFKLPLLSAAETTVVSFDDAGRMIVNDQPEFPVGIYVAIPPYALAQDSKRVSAILDDLQDSPFDILVNYGSPEGTPAERRTYLDELHKRGLRECFSLKDYYLDGVWGGSHLLNPGGYENPEGKEIPKTAEPAIRRTVQALKDHPAILSWYISDEEDEASRVRRHHLWVKEEDASHPTLTLINLRWAHQIAPFTEAGDILVVNNYPIGSGTINHVAKHLDELVKVTQGKRPAWFVVQTHPRYVLRSDFRDKKIQPLLPPDELRGMGRGPTPRELRCMSYLALTHGATGLIYYYYKDIQMAYDRVARWRAVKSIGREVKRLSPVLLAPALASGDIFGDNPLVHWKAKELDGDIFLIAVNSSTRVQNIILDLPIGIETAALREGQGMVYARGSELLLILDGYEAVVVEIDTDRDSESAGQRQLRLEAEGEGVSDAMPDPFVNSSQRGGYWRFEEDHGSTVFDSASQAKHGRIGGKVSHSGFTFGASVPQLDLANRGSMEFFGADGSSLIMPSVSGLDVGADDYTLEAWIHPRGTGERDVGSVIAGKAITGWFQDRGFELGLSPTYTIAGVREYVLYFRGSGLAFSLESETLGFDEWHHVAIVRHGKDLNLFIDGFLHGSTELSPSASFSSGQQFSIGCSAKEGDGGPHRPFDGYIDEVRLTIGRALSTTEFLNR